MSENTLKSFYNACDELVAGKFIVGSKKISNLLKIATNTPEIYKIVSHSLTDFNYDKEFNTAKAKSLSGVEAFVLPREDDKVVALVYCLIQDFDTGAKSLNSFVNKHFGSGLNMDFNQAFLRFTNEVILRFKFAVANLADNNMPKNEVQENKVKAYDVANEEMQADEEADELLSSILEYDEVDDEEDEKIFHILNSIKEAVECDYRLRSDIKDEAIIMLKALKEAIKLENIIIISALSIGFDNVASKIKNIKHLYSTFKEELLSYFN